MTKVRETYTCYKYTWVVRKFKNLKSKEFFGTEFLFLALYLLKIALLSANQNEEIFSCINYDQSDMTTKDELPDCEQNAAMNIDNLLEKINR